MTSQNLARKWLAYVVPFHELAYSMEWYVSVAYSIEWSWKRSHPVNPVFVFQLWPTRLPTRHRVKPTQVQWMRILLPTSGLLFVVKASLTFKTCLRWCPSMGEPLLVYHLHRTSVQGECWHVIEHFNVVFMTCPIKCFKVDFPPQQKKNCRVLPENGALMFQVHVKFYHGHCDQLQTSLMTGEKHPWNVRRWAEVKCTRIRHQSRELQVSYLVKGSKIKMPYFSWVFVCRRSFFFRCFLGEV